jgi:tetratricopeptide (TPR) repeat protein
VVTGSIQTIGSDLRLTMNLVSMESGTPRQLDSFVMDVRLIDIAMLQDHMVSKLAEMMKVDIPPGAAQAVTAGNTSFSEAFGSYVRGVGYLQRYGDLANVDLAIDAFKRATQEDPTYALAYAGLGEAYWWKYHLTKDKSWLAPAIDNCNRAAELNDGLAPVQVSLGIVHNGTGGYEEAVSHFQRAIDLDAGNVDAYRGLAAAYQNLGKFEEAEAAFRTAIATKSDFWAPHNVLGKFYLRRGRYDDAVREFQEVATLTPDNVWAYINLGATYYYMERWPEASDMFRKAIDIKPMSAAFSNLASIEYIQGDYAGSARTYLKALAIDNGKYSTWANLGNAYYWSPGERDKAAEAYRRARELAEQQRNVNPRDASVLAALASYDVMLGDKAAARTHIQQALAIAPSDLYIDYWAAHTYEQLGERDKALDWMGKAIDAGYAVAEIERDPFMEEIRKDSRYRQLVEKQKD